MPTTTYANKIYFGNYAEMDTTENNYTVDNEALLLGETSDHSTGLQIINVTEYDGDSDNQIADDDYGNTSNGDALSYIRDGVNYNNIIQDATLLTNVTITLADGSDISLNVKLVQLQNGDVFIDELSSGGLDNLNIASITINSFLGDNYDGSTTGRDITNSTVVCFCKGTKIQTIHGEVPVEDLIIGDQLLTYDNAHQPIRYIYRTKRPSLGNARPVRFEAGSIGNDQTLLVSQGHRFLTNCLPQHVRLKPINNQLTLLPDGCLVKASQLINHSSIRIDTNCQEVEYYHIMLERHELLYAHGTVSESWQPHRKNLRERDAKTCAELTQYFPELRQMHGKNGGGMTRPEVAFEA